MSRRKALLALLAGRKSAVAGLAASGHAALRAAETDKLAVFSNLGSLSIVVYQPSVGSHLDQNRREVVPLPDATFDQAVTQAAAAALARIPGQAPPLVAELPLASRSGAARLEGGKLVASADLQDSLARSGASHLLLFVRHRSATLLKTSRGSVGAGHLEGLGFYIDRSMRMRRADTQESGNGFLAPFVALQAALIDLRSLEVVREETAMSTATYSAARMTEPGDPWNILTSDQKTAVLQRLLRTEVARMVPLVLSPK